MYENNYNDFFEKVTNLLNEAFGGDEKKKTDNSKEEDVKKDDYSYYHQQKYVNGKLTSEDKVEVVNGKKTIDEHFDSNPKLAEMGCDKKKCNCNEECKKNCDKKCNNKRDDDFDVEIEFAPKEEYKAKVVNHLADNQENNAVWYGKWLALSEKYQELEAECNNMSTCITEMTEDYKATNKENARLKEQCHKLEFENRKLENKLATLKDLLEK